MVLLRSVSAVLSLLLGGKASIVARPPADAPLALLSARCEEFSFSITEGRRILPFKCVAVPVEPGLVGRSVCRMPTEMPASRTTVAQLAHDRRRERTARLETSCAAPGTTLVRDYHACKFGAVATPSSSACCSYHMHAIGRLILAPRLLPLLLAAWLAAPSGPTGGLLFFDSLVREKDLARGAWPAVLSAVLTAITRASLPALLVDLADAADGTAPQDPLGLRSRVPSSECVGASVAGAKLVFEGRVSAVQGQPSLAYTLRTGVSAHRSALGLDGITPLASECSSLCWEEPEVGHTGSNPGRTGMLLTRSALFWTAAPKPGRDRAGGHAAQALAAPAAC